MWADRIRRSATVLRQAAATAQDVIAAAAVESDGDGHDDDSSMVQDSAGTLSHEDAASSEDLIDALRHQVRELTAALASSGTEQARASEEAAQTELKWYQAEVASMRSRLSRMDDEKAHLSEEFSEMLRDKDLELSKIRAEAQRVGDVGHLEDELQAAIDESLALRDRIAELEAERYDGNQENEQTLALQETLSDTRAQYLAAQDELANVADALDRMRGENEAVREELDRSLKDSEERKAEDAATIEGLRQMLIDVHASAERNRDREETENELHELRRQLENAKLDNEKLAAHLKGAWRLDPECGSDAEDKSRPKEPPEWKQDLQIERHEIEGKWEKRVQGLETELEESAFQRAALESRLKDLEQVTIDANERLSLTTANIETLQKREEQLQSLLDLKEKEIADAVERLRTRTQEVNEYEKLTASLRAAESEWVTEREGLKKLRATELERVKDAEEKSAKSEARMEVELDKAKARYDSLQGAQEDLESELRASERERSDLVDELNESKRIVESQAKIARETQKNLEAQRQENEQALSQIVDIIRSKFDSDEGAPKSLLAAIDVLVDCFDSGLFRRGPRESFQDATPRLLPDPELTEPESSSLQTRINALEEELGRYKSLASESAKFDEMLAEMEADMEQTRSELVRERKLRQAVEKKAKELDQECESFSVQLRQRTKELDEVEHRLLKAEEHKLDAEDELAQMKSSTLKNQVNRAEKLEKELLKSQTRYDELKFKLMSAESALESMRNQLSLTQSQFAEAERERDMHRVAAENLQCVLEEFQATKDMEMEGSLAAMRRQLSLVRAELSEACLRADERELDAERLSGLLRDKEMELLSAQADLDAARESMMELRQSVESSLARVHRGGLEEELVDRQIFRQLLVSYFQVDVNRRRDVLELMARMLDFSDEDRSAVGLKRRRLREVLGLLVQAPRAAGEIPPVGNMADKWVEFLIEQTDPHDDDGF